MSAESEDHIPVEPSSLELVSITLAEYQEYEELKEKVKFLTRENQVFLALLEALGEAMDDGTRMCRDAMRQCQNREREDPDLVDNNDDDDDSDGGTFAEVLRRVRAALRDEDPNLVDNNDEDEDSGDGDSDARSVDGEGEASVAVATAAQQVIQQQGGDAEITDSPDSPGEPSKKKLKSASAEDTGIGGGSVISVEISEKLEDRLGSVLCCAVCLGLPRSQIYQCLNGHLLCQACLHHVLADSRIRDETSTCPSCRVEISKHTASRNLAVEKALQELASPCQFCSREFPRNSLDRHENGCEERKTTCKYNKIGCPWEGPKFELDGHEGNCIHPNKTGKEIMEYLESSEKELEKDKKIYKQLFGLLSFEKININEIQLKPYRTEEFVQKLFYESGRFSCFNNQWVIKAKVGSKVRDPTQSCDRDLQYQLILKTKPSAPLDLHFCPFPSPFADMKIKQPAINRFEFFEQNMESPYYPIPLIDSNEVNRLLSAKTINLRLIAFLQ